MTFDELHTFISLAQTKSFSRTADILFTSQSTISFRIRNIESQIGRPLINRTTKRIELTPAGQDFLTYAMRIENLWLVLALRLIMLEIVLVALKIYKLLVSL